MATIKLPKAISEIQEIEALPEDYYKMRIVEEPTVEMNKKQTGENLILSLRVVSEDPAYNGRAFKKWISLPTEADKDKYTSRGQSFENFKLAIISNIEAGFNGFPSEGDEITLEAGQEAWLYVVKTVEDEEESNDIDFFSPVRVAD